MILAIALAVLVGAFVQAVVGLGVGLVTAPLVAVLAPSLMPALPLWFGLFVAGLSLAGERHAVDWHAIAWSVPARIPGTVLGVWLVAAFDSQELGVAVAVMVLLAVALSLRTVSVPISRTSLMAAGFTSGAAGTATSIGGPPIALLFQRQRPSEVRATLAVFFFVGVLMSLSGLLLAGELDRVSLVVALAVSPFLLAGIRLGARLRDGIPRERFRLAVLGVCAVSAIVLIVKSLA